MSMDEPQETPATTTAYMDHRKSLVDLANDQMRTYDKAILNLSSGALGLSIVFVKDIGGGRAGSIGLLYLGWAWSAFILAIILNIVSYFMSWNDAMSEVKRMDDCITGGQDYAYNKNWFRTITSWLNVAAFVSFVAGVSLIARFAYLNLLR